MPVSRAEVSAWIEDYVARVTGCRLGPGDELMAVGLDSLDRYRFVHELEAFLGHSVDAGYVAQCRSIGEITSAVVDARAEPDDLGDVGLHPYERWVNPDLGKLLRHLRFNKVYVRGEGTRLWDDQGREYLDCLAGYGAVPFGHNPTFLWQEIDRFRDQQRPSLVQPSALDAAGRLGEALLAVAPPGLRYVTFANSGAEAVEAGIKMARMTTGRRGILSTQGGFHGKTLAALSATGNANYQTRSGAPAEGFALVPYGDADAVRRRLAAEPGQFAAFIVEPIQGEGGVTVPPPGYLRAVKEACARHGVLLIIDEVQTGLGRTGAMFAVGEEEGVTPDILLVAKALGGGLLPIAAVLSTQRAYCSDFGLKHSSTFAANGFACHVALAVLERMVADDGALIRTVRERGRYLKERLEELAGEYRDVLLDVRGRGLLLGVQLAPPPAGQRSVLTIAARGELYSAVVSSHLLNASGIRVAPTLNGSDVVRVEPPLTVSQQECDRIVSAFRYTCEILRAGDAGRLMREIFNGRKEPLPGRITTSMGRAEPRAVEPERFAFLAHPLQTSDYLHYDRSLGSLAPGELSELSDALGGLIDPFVAGSVAFESPAGRTASGEVILIPRTAAELVAMPEQEARQLVIDARNMAAERGAAVVGLGAYTAVVTRGGRAAQAPGLRVTNGNAYTVLISQDAVTRALADRGTTWSGKTAAIMGAGGSVGSGLVLLTLMRAARLLLVGNPSRSHEDTVRRLGTTLRRALRALPHARALGLACTPGSIGEELTGRHPTGIADDHSAGQVERWLAEHGRVMYARQVEHVLPFADVLFTATSTPGVVVHDACFKPDAVVCDVSQPRNISSRIVQTRPDVTVLDGGLVRVSGGVDLTWLGLPRSEIYACMAETVLLALEPGLAIPSEPELDLSYLLALERAARKHHFELATLRSFGRNISEGNGRRGDVDANHHADSRQPKPLLLDLHPNEIGHV